MEYLLIGLLALILFYAVTDIVIRRLPHAEKGCPGCGRFHDLYPSKNDWKAGLLAGFDRSVSRVQCAHCLWSGTLWGLDHTRIDPDLEDVGDDE